MVYISDTRVKNVNSISKYTIVKRLSLDDAWRKGPAMMVNSSFICVKCLDIVFKNDNQFVIVIIKASNLILPTGCVRVNKSSPVDVFT